MSISYGVLYLAYFISDSFAEPCGVSICSLFDNNTDFNDIIVYIVEDNISDIKKLKEIGKTYKKKIEYKTLPDSQEFFKMKDLPL